MAYIWSRRAIRTTEVFDAWFVSLRDKQGKARIKARLRRVEQGYFGDVRPVGGSVLEFRIHTGPGYRIYFTKRGLNRVVLLAGGDKDTQEKDIRIALELARRL